ncbi:UbiA family prenyltransferase [Nocardioides alkalitolerans]|uniref:UbiA family prenyltransferase n=1 Tax=Nocardioides alkalitolerans TaxID=281714 RepID=UPI00048EF91B|nr:UbiA family prenyltransferase [Nocardioides alkalitolerans]
MTDRPRGSVAAGLVDAAHPGPALAVTVVAGVLASAADRSAVVVALVVLAVLAGQLTVGWANDLLDVERDRAVGRADKPVATGQVPLRVARVALLLAAVACVALSAALGWRSALVHLVLLVGSAHAYNLGVKATAASWAPYAVAFGALPSVAFLADTGPTGDAARWAPWWMTLAGATLGVAAHLLNVLPDLDDDARTGVRGLPHRLGAARSRALAVVLLLAASGLAVLGPAGPPPAWAWAALLVVVGLAVVGLVGRGRAPFRAALLIAVVDVVLLAAVTR